MRFFERFFKKEEKTMTLEEARAEFQRYNGKRKSEKEDAIKAIDIDIRDAMIEMRSKLKKLECAKLLNENLLPREGSIMEGNRKTYIKFSEIFLDRLKKNPGFEEANKIIDDFSKSTFRSYQVLHHFFESEVRDAAYCVKQITELHKKKMRQGNNAIKEIEELFLKINEEKEKEAAFKKEKKDREKECSELKKEVEKIKKAADELKNSKEMKELDEMKNSLIEIKSKRHLAENEIYHSFSQFSKYFRKLNNFRQDKGLQKLIENPVEMFVENPSVSIEFLHELKHLIEKGNISAKEEEKEKIIERIDAINRENLEEPRQEIIHADKKTAHLNEEIDKNKIKEKIWWHEEELKTKTIELNRLENKREERNQESIPELKKKLMEMLSGEMHQKISIE